MATIVLFNRSSACARRVSCEISETLTLAPLIAASEMASLLGRLNAFERTPEIYLSFLVVNGHPLHTSQGPEQLWERTSTTVPLAKHVLSRDPGTRGRSQITRREKSAGISERFFPCSPHPLMFDSDKIRLKDV